MRIDITDLFAAMSNALDAVETEAVGTTTGHGKRVAFIAMKIMQAGGYEGRALADFVGVAILHDNAFSEYLREEFNTRDFAAIEKEVEEGKIDLKEHQSVSSGHWVVGERNIRRLPFRTDVKNFILWHHERADGSGPMGLTQDRTSLGSQAIFLADTLDLVFDLRHIDSDEYDKICCFVKDQKGKMFSDRTVSLFLQAVPLSEFQKMNQLGTGFCLREAVPPQFDDYTDAEIKSIASFFAGIVDYKSSFTKDHSMGVAAKAEAMAKFYGWPQEKVTEYYFAGALHDIGKLMVPNDILEKPDRLTKEEFAEMSNHAAATRYILSRIKGLGRIVDWAANHHEKLDGSGYSQGLTGDRLSFEERLMACIDIYQALTEERPYKKGVSHSKAILIMRSMAKDNKIDAGIVEDMDRFFGTYCGDSPEQEAESGVTRWKCPVCGYIWEGEEPPETCPICGAAGHRFEPVE